MKTAAQILRESGASAYTPAPRMLYAPYAPGTAPLQGAAPAPVAVEVEPPILLKVGEVSNLAPTRRLAILLASRGQVFSRAIESILREAANARGFTEVALFVTHGVKIPDAQSQLVTRALAWNADVTWLVEEDNYMVPGVLAALLSDHAAGKLVASCRYFGHCGTNWVVPEIHCGMKVHAFGCTLVDSAVWRAIGAPYCFVGKHIIADANGQPCEHASRTYNYGGQDIDFSFRVHKLGIPSAHLDGTQWRCGHLHLVHPGDRASNATGASTVAMT